MRDSFVLTFLIMLLIFLAFMCWQLTGMRTQIKQVQHDVAASPAFPDFHDKEVIRKLAGNKNLIPPPPPYTVPSAPTEGVQ